MTPEAIEQVKASCATVAAQPGQLSSRFYLEMFTATPNLRRLFPEDLSSLQRHFEAALALVVRNLDGMDVPREPLRDLGGQPVHWGARPEDYVTAREALIAAIRALSPDWQSALDGYWRSAITSIVVPMIEGAAVHTAIMADQLASDAKVSL